MRAAMLAPSTPQGACSPPPSGRFPPLVCIRRVGLRFFIQLGQAREAGASGPEAKVRGERVRNFGTPDQREGAVHTFTVWAAKLCTRGRGCSSDALTNHHFFMPAERASIPTRSGGCLAALQERPTALRSKA